MAGNRIWKIKRRNDAADETAAGDARRTAFLAIEEIIAAPDTEVREVPRPAPTVVPSGLELPRRVPVPEPLQRPALRKPRRFRLKKRFGIVALTLALAILIGIVVGSGLFSTRHRLNSELYQSQQGTAESYGVRDVQGQPGAGY